MTAADLEVLELVEPRRVKRTLEERVRWSVRILDKLLALGSLDIHDKATVRSVREALALGYQRKEEDIVKHWQLRQQGERTGAQAMRDHVVGLCELARAFDVGVHEVERALRRGETAGAFYKRLVEEGGSPPPEARKGTP